MIQDEPKRGMSIMLEAEHWKALAGWIVGIVGILIASLSALVIKFRDSRYSGLEARVSDNEDDIKDLKRSEAKQDKVLGELTTHIEHIRENSKAAREDIRETKDSIRRIHDKLDKIGNAVNGSS